MVHVNYFLGCIKLETGGIIIAWLHIIFYVIAIGSLIVKLILDFDSDDTIPNNIAELEEITPTTNIEKSYILILAIILVVALAAMIAIIVVAYRSIKAIKIRNHNIMIEMVGMMFAFTCLHLYAIALTVWLAPMKCIPALIGFAIYSYIFVVIYSLYRVFRKEYEHRLEQLKPSA